MSNKDCSKLLLEIVPRTMRFIRTEMRDVAGEEFTVPQFRILGHLSRGPATNREIAQWMGVSAPTVSKIIDKLVARGYVLRRPESSDRRQVVLECTKKGLARAQAIRSTVQSIFADRIVDLTEAKRAKLSAGLKILEEVIEGIAL